MEEVREKELSPEVQTALEEYGGLNEFQKPHYRVVWGWKKRIELSDGSAFFPYGNPGRWLERWHFERWLSVEEMKVNESSWEAERWKLLAGQQRDTMGEFPSQGDYFWIFPFEDLESKEYVEPTVDHVKEAIRRNVIVKNRSASEISRDIFEALEYEEKEKERIKDDIASDGVAAFAGRYWMPRSGRATPEWRRRDHWEPSAIESQKSFIAHIKKQRKTGY